MSKIRPWTMMTVSIGTAIVIVLVIVTSMMGINGTASEPAHLTVAGEPMFNFGTVNEGQIVNAQFRLLNNSKQVIHITRVKTGCGCTQAEVDRNALAPGESTILKMVYEARSVNGVDQVEAVVLTDVPEHPAYVFVMRGQVRTTLRAVPKVITMLITDSEPSRSIDIKIKSDVSDIVIESVTSNLAAVKTVITKTATTKNQIIKLHLLDHNSEGVSIGHLKIKCLLGKTEKTITVPVYLLNSQNKAL